MIKLTKHPDVNILLDKLEHELKLNTKDLDLLFSDSFIKELNTSLKLHQRRLIRLIQTLNVLKTTINEKTTFFYLKTILFDPIPPRISCRKYTLEKVYCGGKEFNYFLMYKLIWSQPMKNEISYIISILNTLMDKEFQKEYIIQNLFSIHHLFDNEVISFLLDNVVLEKKECNHNFRMLCHICSHVNCDRPSIGMVHMIFNKLTLHVHCCPDHLLMKTFKYKHKLRNHLRISSCDS